MNTTDPTEVVTGRINQAAERANAGDLDGALKLYERVFDPLLDETRFHVPAALRAEIAGRRADLLGRLGRFAEALLLLEELDSERRVELITAMLEPLREGDPARLLKTAREVVAWGQRSEDSMAVMAASWFIPYAYRGLGENEKARELATLILGRAREAQHREYIAEWEAFLASLT